MQVGVPPSNRRSVTSFNLRPPESVQGLDGVESHLNWFKNPKFDLQGMEIKATKKLSGVMTWFFNLGELEGIPLTVIGQHFFKSFLEQILGETCDAWVTLDGISTVIGSLQHLLDRESLQALNYLLISEKATYSYQTKDMEAAEYYLEEMKNMFTEGLYSQKARATILFLLGHFIGPCDKVARIHFCREAVDLDPKNWQLNLALYRALRSHRRELDWGCAPYVEEVLTCMKGVELLNELNVNLASDGLRALSNINLTNLLEEVHLAGRWGIEYDHLLAGLLPVGEHLLSCAREAAELTPTCVPTQVKYADALSRFTRGSASKLAECEEQYKYCLETWPKDSRVRHKAGKFYAQQTQRIDYGIQLLHEGIELEDDNFPCWMDYLRYKVKDLMQQQGNEESEQWELILTKLVYGISHFDKRHKQVFKRKLLQAKGTILWNLGYNCEAVNCWIDAFEIEFDPEKWKEMTSSSIFSIKVNFGQVVRALKDMLAADGIQAPRVDIMNELLDAMKAGRKAWNSESDTIGNGGGRTNHRQGYETREADKDRDWRRPGRKSKGNGNDIENLNGSFDSWRLAESGSGGSEDRSRRGQNSGHGHGPYPLSNSWNDSGYGIGYNSATHGQSHGHGNGSTDKRRIRKTSESDLDDNWRK